MTEPPSGPRRPSSQPARGGDIVAGMAIAILIGVVVLSAGSSSHVTGSAARGIAVAQLLVLAGCVAAGVIIFRRDERGIGLGLIMGGALMVLCGPLGGLGPCVNVFGG